MEEKEPGRVLFDLFIDDMAGVGSARNWENIYFQVENWRKAQEVIDGMVSVGQTDISLLSRTACEKWHENTNMDLEQVKQFYPDELPRWERVVTAYLNNQ